MNTGLAEPVDHQVLTNRLLDLLHLEDYTPSQEPQSEDLEEILAGILDYAVAKGLCDDGITARDISADPVLEKHGPWVKTLDYTFTEENALDILLQETGKVFSQVLEDAGVYKNTPEGKAAFLAFVRQVNEA